MQKVLPFILVFLLLINYSSGGQVLAYEGFDYFNSTSVDLHNANLNSSGNPKNGKTILGWADDWVVSGGAGSGYDISSLQSFLHSDGTRSLINSGQFAEGGGGGQTAGRRVQTSAAGFFGVNGITTSSTNPTSTNFVGYNGSTSKTVWFSFLINKINPNSEQTFISLHRNANEFDANGGNSIAVGYFGGTQFWGLRLNGSVSQSTVPISPNTVTLLVMSVTFNTDLTNTVNLYINPLGIGNTLLSAPVLTQSTAAIDNSFNAVAMFGGNSPGQSQFDELRFGATFADATLSSNQVETITGLCTGAFGDNIFSLGDFGPLTGSNETNATYFDWTQPTPVVFKNDVNPWNTFAPGYSYVENVYGPNDNEFTIATGVRNIYDVISGVPTWITTQDNSPNKDGLMMVLNSNFDTGPFYNQNITGICEKTKYEFSADVINLFSNGIVSITNPGGVYSNLYFPICDTILEPGCQQFSNKARTNSCSFSGSCVYFSVNPQIEFQIGGISVYSPPYTIPNDNNWHKIGFTFYTLPGITSLNLSLINTAPGGIGNDIGIDNITFKPCGPKIPLTSTIPSCNPAKLVANVIGTEYITPNYQWQKVDSTVAPPIWNNITGANNSSYFPVSADSLKYIRALVANSASNLLNPNCRVITASQKIYCNPGGFPLPVNLIYFNAHAQLDKILLQWKTGFEKDNISFEVQRSGNGKDFKSIAIVEGSGNSNSVVNYAYFDNEPFPGLNYYRLKQNNIDGTFTYSKVEVVRMESTIVLYPNPAKDFVKITFEKSGKKEEKIILRLLNIMGITVKFETVIIKNNDRQSYMQLSGLQNGIYYLEIQTETEKVSNKLIIAN